MGDFSYDGRHASHNIILCRDESIVEEGGYNFRTLRDTDEEYWHMIDDNMDMWAACPASTLIQKWQWRRMYFYVFARSPYISKFSIYIL